MQTRENREQSYYKGTAHRGLNSTCLCGHEGNKHNYFYNVGCREVGCDCVEFSDFESMVRNARIV